MGARINFIFKQDNSGHNVTLYSHWGADTWESDLANALDAAKPRWSRVSDPSYAIRIVVSQLIGSSWVGETGYGLFVSKDDELQWLDFPVTIDFVNKTVNGKSFDKFINYHKEEANA